MSFRRMLGLAGLTGPLVAAALGPGCGEPFVAGVGGAGGGTTTTTTTTTTSDGGQGGVGGMAQGGGGAGGAGGTGGGPGLCDPNDPAACDPGQYCAANSLSCVSCAVLGDTLAFGPATPLALTSPGTDPSFPRARMAASGEELVFSAVKAPSDTDIALAQRDALGVWQDGVFAPNIAMNTALAEWAPVRLPPGKMIPGFPGEELVIYSALTGVRRQIWTATPDGTTRTLLPNANDATKDTYSLAIAWDLAPPRYWYMRKIGAADQLRFVTHRATESTATPIAAVTLPGDCDVVLTGNYDLAPWVTPNGSHLFFQADYPAGCSNSGPRRSFWVRLDQATWGPAGEAQEIPIMGLSNSAPVLTPSLSPDLCSIYFSTPDQNGDLTLHTARRR